MDFARPHLRQEGVTTRSKIRVLPVDAAEQQNTSSLDSQVIHAANQAALDLFGCRPELANSRYYPERVLDSSKTIQPNDLVVVQVSFANLDFVYATPGARFSNRNGHFAHDDFIGKPFGCKIRSRDHQGYGYVYLLKPTPELWARSLPHRTQIVHELDASMVVFYLHLRPNMVVCESGTGSGAMSHSILRTIAPHGKLHTYEFNQSRVERAREEFEKHKVDHLVTVHHKDVCGKSGDGGFGLGGQAAHAVFLDLPEPWLAVPHAAYVLKPSGRLASYSPCVEQSQRAIEAMKRCGFHSIKTIEVRLREHYVDEVEWEPPPCEKRPHRDNTRSSVTPSKGEADKEAIDGKEEPSQDDTSPDDRAMSTKEDQQSTTTKKRKRMLCARPFATMRGHTAFLTFATAGNKPQCPAPIKN